MVRLTVLARLEDGLPLAEGVESDKELGQELETLKPQAKVTPRPCLSHQHSLRDW